MEYNFDELINRRGTASLRYDLNKNNNDMTEMWIADMDFKTAPCIIKSIEEAAGFGIYGYTDYNDVYYDAVVSWYKQNFKFDIKKECIARTPGVIFALSMAVLAYTEKNDNIIIFSPVYRPFREVIKYNDRNIVECELKLENNKYQIDFDNFEDKIKNRNIKMLIFCSPHNPGGRVWTKDELVKISEICEKYKVFIVSDEIHSDFVWKGYEHIVFSTISDYVKNNSIVCTAPSKTFNLAGLQASNIFIQNEKNYNLYNKQIDKTGYHRISQFAQIATIAAYTYGRKWLDALLKYINSNIEYAVDYIQTNLKKVKIIQPEGTYLLWLDFREYNMSEDELKNKLLNDLNLHLDEGSKYGEAGIGFMRMNLATPKKNVEIALEKLKNWI